jgi:hypothetical protein
VVHLAGEANVCPFPLPKQFEESRARALIATDRFQAPKDPCRPRQFFDGKGHRYFRRFPTRRCTKEQGFSTLYVAATGNASGWIGLQDKARPEGEVAVSEMFESQCPRVTMLTGDRGEVANRVLGDRTGLYRL